MSNDPCKLIDSALRETRGRMTAMARQSELLDAANRLIFLAHSLGAEVRLDLRPVGLLSIDLSLSLALEVPEPCDAGPVTVDSLRGCGWDCIEDCPPTAHPVRADNEAEGGGEGSSGAVMADALTAAPDQGKRPQTAGEHGGALPPSDDPGLEAAPEMAASRTGELNRGAWSEREDATAVRMRLEGASPPEIARALHRPVPATEYRVYKTLRDRIEVARGNREGGARPNATARPEAPGAGVAAPAPVTLPAAAPAGNAAEAAPGAGGFPQTTLKEHLDALPDEGWALHDDLDLMNATMSRVGIPDLEELFGRKISVLRQRKEKLTAAERFTVAEVQAELQARADVLA